MLITTAIVKLYNDFFRSEKSDIPTLKPNPMIGPIRGEISIAPMITAVELTFNPMDATNMAKMSVQTLTPLKTIPFLISSIVLWLLS